MKHINVLIIAALVGLLSSCNSVVFTEPQPAKVATEVSFPAEWQGVYYHVGFLAEGKEGESWAKVTDQEIILYWSRTDSVPYIEGTDYEVGEKPEMGAPIQVMMSGKMVDAEYRPDDWARYHLSKTETIGLSDSLILKLQDSWACLSSSEKKHGNLFWNMFLVEPARNGDLMIWWSEDGKEGANEMRKFFEVEEHWSPAHADELLVASPEKSQLEEYILAGGFSDLFMWLSTEFDYDDVPEALK